MRRLLLILTLFAVLPGLAATLPDETKLMQELRLAENNKNQPEQAKITEALQAALSWLNESKASVEQTKRYQKTIDDFPRLSRELNQQISNADATDASKKAPESAEQTDQEIVQVSAQLIDQTRRLQQEQDKVREISNSLSELPRQLADARQALADASQRLQNTQPLGTPFGQAQLYALQTEVAARKAKVDELELAQLSAKNRLELAQLRATLYQKQNRALETYLRTLRNNISNQRQQQAEKALASSEQMVTENENLPARIKAQLDVNRKLSQALNEQTERLNAISAQQSKVHTQTLQVQQAVSTIKEQAQWVNKSSVLGESLRAQVAALPPALQPQKLDSEMARYRVHWLNYKKMLDNQAELRQLRQDNGEPLTATQKKVLDAQLKIQTELLNTLLTGCNDIILAMTKLKVSEGQLNDALIEAKEAIHRYLFWTADISPITVHWPLQIAQNLTRLLSLDTLAQLGGASVMILTNFSTLLPVLFALLLVIISVRSRRHYNAFLKRASHKVGRVPQDHFSLTLRTVLWSILIALPVPVLWSALGYGLQQAWPYPIAIAVGEGVMATQPLLWSFMICAAFARPRGLFIVHFRWSRQQVARAMRYYTLSIGFIVPLIMALITFDNLNDSEFTATLGRLCFILVCIALTIVTVSLKRAGIPLYLTNNASSEHFVSRILWNLLIIAPLFGALFSCLGYLATSRALLARLETSVVIWFVLLLIYQIIQRWMILQRQRIAYDRARHRRAELLASRTKEEEDNFHNSNEALEIDEPVINLEAISSQSLRLVRSILTFVALIALVVLWSELHSAFSFLENITLWDVTSTVQGVESLKPITLGTILIAVLVFVITAQLVHNLPALLELTILQHIHMSPGTGYAITTLTKYLIMLIGGLVGFSLIGIEWAKLQWLVAALGVGLGFGLQQIFANFISGLILLFEKPMRIGDTVTIRDLTGSVLRINIRATTIVDWDRKEIIVPNQAFITEQFINWSLTDAITRIVLTIPAPPHADSEEVAQLLRKAAHDCALVLKEPQPETYLVDLQQGIQLFELRIYAAEMGHRMPIRHEVHRLILQSFHQHGIELPFPPFQARVEAVARNGQTTLLSSSRRFTPGSV